VHTGPPADRAGPGVWETGGADLVGIPGGGVGPIPAGPVTPPSP